MNKKAIYFKTIASLLSGLLISLIIPLISCSNLRFNFVLADISTTSSLESKAEQIIYESDGLLKAGEEQKSLNKLQNALEIYRQIHNLRQQGVIYIKIGSIYYDRLAIFKESEKFFEQALILFRDLGDVTGEAKSLLKLAYNYERSGKDWQKLVEKAVSILEKELKKADLKDYRQKIEALITLASAPSTQKTQDLYQQALDLARRFEDQKATAKVLREMGASYTSHGEYQKAIECYEQALLSYKAIEEKYFENSIEVLQDIAIDYQNLFQNQKEIETLNRALLLARKSQNKREEWFTLHSLSNAYGTQYQNSLKAIEEALPITQVLGDRRGEGYLYSISCSLSTTLGQYQKALEACKRSLEIVQEVGYSNRFGLFKEEYIRDNIPSLYKALGREQEALGYIEQNLDAAKKKNERDREIDLLNNLGLFHFDLGQYQKALEYHQKALVIIKERKILSSTDTFEYIGDAYSRLEETQKALAFYKQALRSLEDEMADKTIMSSSEYRSKIFGRLLLKNGRPAEAADEFSKAAKITESYRTGLSDQNKVSLFDTQTKIYQYWQQALIMQNKSSAALEVAEQGRARAYIELLALKLTSTSYAQTVPKPITYQQIQQIAQQQHATLVEYSIISIGAKPGIYIWVVKPNGEVAFQIVELNYLNTSLKELINVSRQSIGVRSRSSIELISSENISGNSEKYLQQLFDLLVKPILAHLPTKPDSPVIFIPQGELFLVPFAALQDSAGKSLIEEHIVLSAPSIQVLQFTQQLEIERRSTAQNNTSPALVVGDPTMPRFGYPPKQLPGLQGAKQEAIEVAQLLNTKALTGNEATKAVILPKLLKAGIVHLATHGLLDDFKGLGVPGAIALAPIGNGEVDDGWLTASEISDMKLRAELVILSACDTGRGNLTGDGVIGLSRSFITAGAPSVIVSLWSVPDSPTAKLMTEFYRNLKLSSNKAMALRQAMLTTKKQYPNSKDWAAFTLIGEAE